MIKQVYEMPTSGAFTVSIESESKGIIAHSLYWHNGGVHNRAGGVQLLSSEIAKIKMMGSFFVSVSEFEKITFGSVRELLNHLRENEGARLYSEPDDGASTVYFSGNEYCHLRSLDDEIAPLDKDAPLQKEWHAKRVQFNNSKRVKAMNEIPRVNIVLK